ncbi:hypothetical protein [Halalkalibaculum sp. DA384]|uniref:hypothetical protein n=1 Tax=Halalkalibaculum sp. DA384 TaxID=3373606 RepID=UPI0037541865
MQKDKFRVDRNAFSVTSLQEQDKEEKMYWKDKTPHERLEAMELTRQIIYGYDPATTRLQRILEVTERSKS